MQNTNIKYIGNLLPRGEFKLHSKFNRIVNFINEDNKIIAISEGADDIIIDADYEYVQLDITNYDKLKDIVKQKKLLQALFFLEIICQRYCFQQLKD